MGLSNSVREMYETQGWGRCVGSAMEMVMM